MCNVSLLLDRAKSCPLLPPLSLNQMKELFFLIGPYSRLYIFSDNREVIVALIRKKRKSSSFRRYGLCFFRQNKEQELILLSLYCPPTVAADATEKLLHSSIVNSHTFREAPPLSPPTYAAALRLAGKKRIFWPAQKQTPPKLPPRGLRNIGHCIQQHDTQALQKNVNEPTKVQYVQFHSFIIKVCSLEITLQLSLLHTAASSMTL